ncbi:methionine ABC transporter permease [Raineyella sp. W15-4]|uniref:methionine ABC transporter permease n=1 Tax=Raineyella sp. W15-4 TaxID=3081651 RepID=UPI00295408E9|nr:methionine ABC transporter permease [Raineyella sp. W15-4]WOQ18085.1 methionine ABC transporter permease [Raineyella sp. W15-4]
MNWDLLGPTFVSALQQTMAMVLSTLVIGGLLGLAVGVALFVTRAGNLYAQPVVYWILNVVVNIVRPIPFIIFITAVGPLTLLVVGTTIGTSAAIFPMSFMATFAIARVVEQNLVAVDPGVIEAARAMGAGRLRIILTVLVPEALGPLILGYTFMFIGIVDMSAMAGTIGGGGLGDFAITYGYQQFNWVVTWITVAVIVVIVQLAQVLGNWGARKVLRR